MELTMYQVDAFTDHVFGGNPPAVCLLEGWLSDELMVSMAAENNLAETAFFVPESEGFRLRWFTPLAEVDLCGRAWMRFRESVFVPKLGINEDPVTGSAHCELAPLWSELLGKADLVAVQVSSRRGDIVCDLRNDRVVLKGKVAHFMTALMTFPT